jgi:prepilin-type N-terminal cleavage/methylation domain-containing protein
MKRNQSGFTLIEIAIVLVIIGLLLGGVLKGQELINSAKVKNLASDFTNVPLYINVYQDKFKALPGDDGAAATHLLASASLGNGNGTIDGFWKPLLVSDESALFWQHIRLANLAPGSTIIGVGVGNTFMPQNTLGGAIGVSNLANSPINGLHGTYVVCSDAIPGKLAQQLDIAIDDGIPNTGALQLITTGSVATLGTAITPAVLLAAPDANYLVCMGN